MSRLVVREKVCGTEAVVNYGQQCADAPWGQENTTAAV
jgi:hypothetical protein